MQSLFDIIWNRTIHVEVFGNVLVQVFTGLDFEQALVWRRGPIRAEVYNEIIKI